MILLFIRVLCKVETVSHEMLTLGFDTNIEKDSNLLRNSTFLVSYILDQDLITRLVFSFLPKEEKYELTMDITN